MVQYPIDKNNIKGNTVQAPGTEGAGKLALYIHIPFCQRKCLYCDFLSFPPDTSRASSMAHAAYAAKLCEELACMSRLLEKEARVSSVFFGGGTPSVLEPALISRIMACIRQHYPLQEDAEISIELNPASALREKLSSYLADGFNRLSIGLQSCDNRELAVLGRIHRFEDFLLCYQAARAEGFRNINLDLIYGLPGQTADSFRKSLESALQLCPEHLSLYSLIVEEGTPYDKMQQEGRLPLPDEDTVLAMDDAARECTGRYGYVRYEISNYAKPGFLCRHNYGYWSDVPYLGFGLGASSYFHGIRAKNTEDLEAYLALDMEKAIPPGLRIEERKLSRKDRMEEFCFLGLRRTEGISEHEFLERFSVDLKTVFGEKLDSFVWQGFMEYIPSAAQTHGGSFGRYRFTERGMDISNALLCQLLLDEELL